MQFLYTALSHPIVKRVLAYSVIAVCAVALFHLIKNQGAEYYYKHNPDAIMKEIPFYSLIKEHEPALYNRIEKDVSLAIDNKQTPLQLKSKVKTYLDSFIAERVPVSTNEAVVAYTKVTLDEMRQLKNQGYGLCHRFLYPSSTPLNLEKYLHKDLMQQDLDALTAVIKASYLTPQQSPRGAEVQLYISHVLTKLSQTYSEEELKVLSNPMGILTDKDKVCEITIALFEEILKLPQKQSGETLRYIVTQNQP